VIIDLKLGSIKACEIAEAMCAELLTLSANAPDREIERITGDIPEITKNTLYIIDDDNSLAEMMAAAKNGAYTVLCTKAPASLEKIPDSAVIVCDNIMRALERLAKQYGNNFAFVKTYQDAVADYTAVDQSVIEGVLVIVYENIKDTLSVDGMTAQGRKKFTDNIKKESTKDLLKAGLYQKIKAYYDAILNELYTNIQIYK